MDNSKKEKKSIYISGAGCLLGVCLFASILLVIGLAAMYFIGVSGANTLTYIDKAYNETCSYAGCSNEAESSIRANLLDSQVPYVRENSNYELESSTYQKYSTRDTKDTYLVPDSKGLKVTTVYGQEKYADGKGRVSSIEGYYCAEHEAAGQALVRSEARRSATWGKPWFQVCLVLAVIPWIVLMISRLKKRRKKA